MPQKKAAGRTEQYVLNKLVACFLESASVRGVAFVFYFVLLNQSLYLSSIGIGYSI